MLARSLIGTPARLLAAGDHQRRKSPIVLSAAQPLLLNGEFYFAVVDNCDCAVVVIA
jgi:hypothetical protein